MRHKDDAHAVALRNDNVLDLGLELLVNPAARIPTDGVPCAAQCVLSPPTMKSQMQTFYQSPAAMSALVRALFAVSLLRAAPLFYVSLSEDTIVTFDISLGSGQEITGFRRDIRQ